MGDEKPQIECYIHSVSPIRKSGRTSYFNYVLQTEDSIKKGVSFNLERREAMETLSKQKSPVKIDKYQTSDKYGREDVLVNKDTTITPTMVNFAYQDQEEVISIASLNHVASEQLITIKGYLAHLGCTKKISINGSEVKKQEGYIADPSGFIKVIFWGGHADNQQEGCTYVFKKIRIRTSQGQIYLNTPKQEEECSIEPTDPFRDPTCQVDDPSVNNDLIGSIIGVLSSTRNLACGHCSRKVNIKGNLALCATCKMTQKKDACDVTWYFKLFVQSKQDGKKVHLHVFNQSVVQKIFHMKDLTDDSSEDDILCALLELSEVKITYDSQTHNIIDIELIDI